jgi:hypothetical protein
MPGNSCRHAFPGVSANADGVRLHVHQSVSLADYLPVYERSLLGALRDIVDAIPHGDLSIQWDVCQEVLVYENYFPHHPPSYKSDICRRVGATG